MNTSFVVTPQPIRPTMSYAHLTSRHLRSLVDDRRDDDGDEGGDGMTTLFSTEPVHHRCSWSTSTS
jgi:hypothetical protein